MRLRTPLWTFAMIQKNAEPIRSREVSNNLADRYAELVRLRRKVLYAERNQCRVYHESGRPPAVNSGEWPTRERNSGNAEHPKK
jgi:hypothetical protein